MKEHFFEVGLADNATHGPENVSVPENVSIRPLRPGQDKGGLARAAHGARTALSRLTMPLLLSAVFAVALLAHPCFATSADLPEGFVYVDRVVPGAVFDVRYYGTDNFVGARVDGYRTARVILTEQAAEALAGVQKDLAPFGLGIKVFDGYRPQMAVDHFVRWAKDLDDTKMKAAYYPDVEKQYLFRDGYIAAKSGHTRGSTVDLTLVDRATDAELDMGTGFDFFGPPSWPENLDMPGQVRANRMLLRWVMEKNGFKPLKEEWWHFTLKDEPYPDTYFEFPVE